jgi:YbbR domain-containing protein
MPVAVENIPEGLVIVDPNGLPRPDQTNISQVAVTVKTDMETLSQLRQRDLRAFVDLDGLGPGDHQMKVQVEAAVSDLRISSFSSIEAEPENISVRLEQWIQKTVPLTIEVEGNLPFSFERGEPSVTSGGEPIEQVMVEGPQNRIERVVGAQGITNIEQARASYRSAVQLDALDANQDLVEGVEITPSTVRVEIPINSVVGLKRVPVLGDIVGSPAPGYRVTGVESQPPLINISGGSRQLNDVNSVTTRPVDINGATRTFTTQVGLDLPAGVSLHASEESEVVVMVEIKTMTRPFQVTLPFQVQVEGTRPDLIVEVNPEIIQVPLKGPATALSNLNQSVLIATADVRNAVPGTYTLKPEIDLPEGIEVDAEAIPDVTVSLQLPPTATPTPTPTPLPPPTSTPLPPTSTPIPAGTLTPFQQPTAESTANIIPPQEDETPPATLESSLPTRLPGEPNNEDNLTALPDELLVPIRPEPSAEREPRTSTPLEETTTMPEDITPVPPASHPPEPVESPEPAELPAVPLPGDTPPEQKTVVTGQQPAQPIPGNLITPTNGT